jgi:hypothetical protein
MQTNIDDPNLEVHKLAFTNLMPLPIVNTRTEKPAAEGAGKWQESS